MAFNSATMLAEYEKCRGGCYMTGHDECGDSEPCVTHRKWAKKNSDERIAQDKVQVYTHCYAAGTFCQAAVEKAF